MQESTLDNAETLTFPNGVTTYRSVLPSRISGSSRPDPPIIPIYENMMFYRHMWMWDGCLQFVDLNKTFQHSQIFYNDKKIGCGFNKKYLNYIHTLRQFSQYIDADGSICICMERERESVILHVLYCLRHESCRACPVSVTQMNILIYSVAIDFWPLNAIIEQTESSIPEASRVLSTQVEDSQVT